jgi:CDP-diglyceride synthetase
MKNKIQELKTNPKVQESIKSLKPQKSIWGFLGVVLFFIVPEIIAFIYGTDITAYANEALTHQNGYIEDLYYKALVELFENGGSWLNLAIGLALIVWLFKDD